MRITHLAVLAAGLGLTACVGVSDGRYPAPYSTFSGGSSFVTPYNYQRGPDAYLYDQSRRSWQPNAYPQNRGYGPPRHAPPNRRYDPRRNPGQGPDNRRDRD